MFMALGGRGAVPLLLPDVHGLPFGMAVELLKAGRGRAPGSGGSRSSMLASYNHGAYHLHFVICGKGHVNSLEVCSRALL